MNHYDIAEIYGEVVQGEGFHAGHTCGVLRFGKCNLWPSKEKLSTTCPWCDTPNLHDHQPQSIHQVVSSMEMMHDDHPNHGLIITGGEPLLQLDAALLGILSDLFPWIDIETNGTLPLKCTKPENVFISCSPKANLLKIERVDWYKVLIPDKQHLLPIVLERASSERAAVYVQPVEIGGYSSEITQENIRKCLAICNQYGYVRLSIQMHKIIGVR